MGAFGEVFTYFSLAELGVSRRDLRGLRDGMFSPSGGASVKGSDVLFGGLGVDIKTFDCDARKRWFAINRQKHEALRDRCRFYLCVMAPPLGRAVAVPQLVPHHHVDQWESRDLGGYGDIALVLSLATFCEQYLDGDLYDELPTFRRSALRDDAVAKSEKQARLEVVRHFPTLYGWV
jgi:hypothetical protein